MIPALLRRKTQAVGALPGVCKLGQQAQGPGPGPAPAGATTAAQQAQQAQVFATLSDASLILLLTPWPSTNEIGKPGQAVSQRGSRRHAHI